jgi:hypothetical protein
MLPSLLLCSSGTTGESVGATSGAGRGSTPGPSGTEATSSAKSAGKIKPH